MAKGRDLILVFLNAAVVVAGTLFHSYLLPLSVPVLAIDALSFKRKAHASDEQVAEAAKSIESHYRKRGSLLLALHCSGSGPVNTKINENGRRLMLGERELAADSGNRNLDELFRIVSFGVQKGKSITRNLEAFRRRIDTEIASRNRLKSKVGGMQTLSYMGMVLFLPLFGGISTGIIGTSLGIVGVNAFAIQHGFTVLIEAYVFIMLLITTAFRKPGAGLLQNLAITLPMLLVASDIMLIASSYIPNAI